MGLDVPLQVRRSLERLAAPRHGTDVRSFSGVGPCIGQCTSSVTLLLLWVYFAVGRTFVLVIRSGSFEAFTA